MKKAIPVEIFDSEGNLVRIEFNEINGTHILDAVWDPNDQQTSENRVAFRRWAYRMVSQTGIEIDV